MPHGISLSADAAHVHGHGAGEIAIPITDIFARPGDPESCQWAIFLRNHDELTLEMVTDEGARLSVDAVYATMSRPAQSRHPPRLGSAAAQRSPQHRADERAAHVDAGDSGSSTMADEIGMGSKHSISRRPATACARPCNGRPTAMAASRAPIRNASYLPVNHGSRLMAYQAVEC
jgi:maltose alpha-D-glucosyltransferase/alpha-amylase